MTSLAHTWIEDERIASSSAVSSTQPLLKSIASRIPKYSDYGVSAPDEVEAKETSAAVAPKPLERVRALGAVRIDAVSAHTPGIHQRKTLVQEWEGIVDSLDEEVFRGYMRPILGERRAESFSEFGEFDISTLNAEDQAALGVGVRFRWCIGVLWEGSNPYDYQHLYIPKYSRISEAESKRVQSDVERFSKLFSAS